MSRITVLLALLLFPPTSTLLGYMTGEPSIIPTDSMRRSPGTVKVCPSAELYEDTRIAVDEWNRAISFFAVRFMWLELLDLRLDVAESDCDAYIVLGKPYEIPLGDGKYVLDKRVLGLTYYPERGGGVFNVVLSDLLPREKRVDVIRHELVHVLGLLDTSIPRSVTSGLGKVTSHDVYALYAKYAMGADDTLVRVPPYIPHMTADMPLPDMISTAISVLTAFELSRRLRVRK